MDDIDSGENEGSPTSHDDSEGSSPSSSATALTDISSDLFARAEELGQPASDEPEADGSTNEGKAPSKAKNKGKGDKPGAKADADEGKTNPAKDANADEAGKEKPGAVPEGFVPKAAFEGRVKELSTQKRELREKLSTSEKKNAELDAALKIAVEQSRHYRELLQKGVKFDPTQDELNVLKLRERASQAQAEVDAQHQATLDEASEEEAIEEARLKLEDEVTQALSTNDLIGRPELVAELRSPAMRGKTIAQVAAILQQRREAAAKKRFNIPERTSTTNPPTTPKGPTRTTNTDDAPSAWPKTAKARAGGNAGKRYGADLESMTARLEEIEAANR